MSACASCSNDFRRTERRCRCSIKQIGDAIFERTWGVKLDDVLRGESQRIANLNAASSTPSIEQSKS